MKNTLEVRIAAGAIALVALVATAALVWRYVFPGAYWVPPDFPRLHGFAGFAIYNWAWIAIWIALALSVGVAVVRRARFNVALMATLVPLIGGTTIVTYAPFYGTIDYRMDRVHGQVEEPVLALRRMVVTITLTIAISVVAIAISRLRHTPALARASALATFAILIGVMSGLILWFMITPISNGWQPSDWDRRDLLVPFQPCRGALLWQADLPSPLARIDDLWLYFSDPRAGGETTRAVSVDVTFRRRYAWLTMPEVAMLRVRQDDSAIRRCDSRFREELVTPAKWHELGVNLDR